MRPLVLGHTYPVGRVVQLRPIYTPTGVGFAKDIVGQAGNRFGAHVDHEEVRAAFNLTGYYDVLTIGRPGGGRKGRYAVEENSPVGFALFHVSNHQRVVALADHRVSKLLGVGRPSAAIFDVA